MNRHMAAVLRLFSRPAWTASRSDLESDFPNVWLRNPTSRSHMPNKIYTRKGEAGAADIAPTQGPSKTVKHPFTPIWDHRVRSARPRPGSARDNPRCCARSDPVFWVTSPGYLLLRGGVDRRVLSRPCAAGPESPLLCFDAALRGGCAPRDSDCHWFRRGRHDPLRCPTMELVATTLRPAFRRRVTVVAAPLAALASARRQEKTGPP